VGCGPGTGPKTCGPQECPPNHPVPLVKLAPVNTSRFYGVSYGLTAVMAAVACVCFLIVGVNSGSIWMLVSAATSMISLVANGFLTVRWHRARTRVKELHL
jgi:hypothetical protein